MEVSAYTWQELNFTMYYGEESTRGRDPLYIQDRSGCLTGINNNLTPHKNTPQCANTVLKINSKAAAELPRLNPDRLFNVLHNTFRLLIQCVGAKAAININSSY